MPVLETFNAFKHGSRTDQTGKCKYLIKAYRIHLPFYLGMLQDRFDFGPKNKGVLHMCIK
ncbi:hypothetical protein D3C85_1432830 [compost metagenome]